MRSIEMIGKTFGMATVLIQVEHQGKRKQYLCKCSCGNDFVALGENLRRLHAQSCGCFCKSQISKALKKHGEASPDTITVEYKTWSNIKRRCYNVDDKRYSHYGGRGVKVCDRWLESFENFLEDMGRRPTDGHSIDRIDVNGHYEPSNCKWSTAKEQSNNKRNNININFNGQTKTLTEWSEITGLNYGTLKDRLAYGWSVDEMLTFPANVHYRRAK